MELGVGSIVYEFAGIPLKRAIERIADFGLKYVNILAFYEYNPALYPISEYEAIARQFQKYDMQASSVVACVEGNLASDNLEEREKCLGDLQEITEFLKYLGGKQVLIGKGVGNVTSSLSRERAWRNVVAFLKRYCEWCLKEEMLVTLELEPEPFYVLNSTEAMLKMIKEVNAPNLFANIDIGHLNILREGPERLSPLKDYIIHAHITDNDAVVHTNSVIGTGNCDITGYMNKLLELGVDEVAEKQGVKAVAGIELGHPGEYICDPDYRVLRSVGVVLRRVPHFKKR